MKTKQQKLKKQNHNKNKYTTYLIHKKAKKNTKSENIHISNHTFINKTKQIYKLINANIKTSIQHKQN